MNKEIKLDEIYTEPIYLKIILYIFHYQKDRKTYATNICSSIFQPTNYVIITETAEYIKTRRLLKYIEKKKLIKKVAPTKEDNFKTHYQINLDVLVEFIIDFIKVLPVKRNRKYSLLKELKYKKNRNIKNIIGIYYRSLSFDIEEYHNLNLKDSIFLFIDKIISKKFPLAENDEKYYSGLVNEIQKIKDKDKKNFWIFLTLLAVVSMDYVLYSNIMGEGYIISEYIDYVCFSIEDKKGFSEIEDIKKILQDEENIFKYYPVE